MKTAILHTIRAFADSVMAKVLGNAEGEPEAQLSAPVPTLIEGVGKLIHRQIVAKAESRLGPRLGIPDFGVIVDGALCGYIELKAPGEGAKTETYRGRNKDQWERFSAQPNILYTDGNEWCLYQNGEPAEKLLRFSKDITRHGGKGVTESDAEHFISILTKLIAWSPIVPEKPKEQAALLAPLCRLLRGDVADALLDPTSPLVGLAKDWRSLLFPDASDERFADSYAQTVTFALLLARSEGADVSDLGNAFAVLEAGHTLLSRALQVLTDAKARKEIDPSLILLQRVINAFPAGAMKPAKEDPWLFFYEYFLSAYDPKLRKDSGVYYTPVEVVKCQVALVDGLLRSDLRKAGGFAHKDVITLDPAVGTGTYLLGVVERAMSGVAAHEGAGMIKPRASALARNLFGFEIMVGPYAVSELRLTRALKDRGATIEKDGLGVYLADTLESPFGKPPQLPQFFEPIAEQHEKALEVKDKKSVIVCLGNPPYDRHEAVGEDTSDNRARSGGWVRWGDDARPSSAILEAFVKPARDAGHGGDVKNLYNLYIYFWRWALWKVFEPGGDTRTQGAGVVSFITAASYIRGDAFVGVREMMRRLCHQVWIIDLGGEGRGTRRDENVFNIQTPVAICIAMCRGGKKKDEPAIVKYASIRGTRAEKLAKLSATESFKALNWEICPADWHAPLRPRGEGAYFSYPKLTDLMPWQTSGAQIKRKWPIAPDDETLHRRWRKLLLAEDRGKAFVETRDRKIGNRYPTIPGIEAVSHSHRSIADLTAKDSCPATVAYGYRSFDRQRIIADNRVGDYMRLSLWAAHGNRQTYLTSLLTKVLGSGPALTATACLPDLDHFSNRGAKDVLPLYRDQAAKDANIRPGLLAAWSRQLKHPISPEQFIAYIYGLLAHPGFTDRFFDELEDGEVRVPLTLDTDLFCDVYATGATLLHLHTYGARFSPPGKGAHGLPRGKARCTKTINEDPSEYPQTYQYFPDTRVLQIQGGEIAPIEPEIWSYSVSNFPVVASWLGYRMKDRKGKRSSPLDNIHPDCWTADFTEELLKLLWILEHTVALHPHLATLLDKVCAGPLFDTAHLPVIPNQMRKGSPIDKGVGLYDDADDGSGNG